MSDLNDMVRVYVGDANVVTVPLVDNLTASNAAPKASTVGAALAEKVDTDSVMEHVTITFNEVQSDNQGVILATAEDIPIDDTQGADDIKTYVDAIGAKTAEEIVYEAGETDTIKDVVDALAENIDDVAENLLATEIKMSSSDTTTVSEKITAIDGKTAADIPYGTGSNVGAALASMGTSIETLQTGQVGVVKVSAQSFTDGEKVQARTNIGAAGTADTVSVNAQTLSTSQQGQARENIGALGAGDVADVVRASEQTLSAAQQIQARENIGAASQSDMSTVSGNMSGMFRVESYSVTYESISVGTLNITRGDLGITDIEGYRPTAIVNYNMNSYLNLYYTNPTASTSDAKVLSVRNFGSSALSNSTITIGILWIKTALFQQ